MKSISINTNFIFLRSPLPSLAVSHMDSGWMTGQWMGTYKVQSLHYSIVVVCSEREGELVYPFILNYCMVGEAY